MTNSYAWDNSKILKGYRQLVWMIVNAAVFCVLQYVIQEVSLFLFFTTAIEKIEEYNFIEIILDTCVVQEKEVLDQEHFDWVLINCIHLFINLD